MVRKITFYELYINDLQAIHRLINPTLIYSLPSPDSVVRDQNTVTFHPRKYGMVRHPPVVVHGGSDVFFLGFYTDIPVRKN